MESHLVRLVSLTFITQQALPAVGYALALGLIYPLKVSSVLGRLCFVSFDNEADVALADAGDMISSHEHNLEGRSDK